MGWELNNNAPKKDKRRYQASTVPVLLSSATGGALIGRAIGDEAERAAWSNPAVKSTGQALKEGAKAMPKTTAGKVGIGLTAAGVGGAQVLQNRAKKKGTLIKKDAGTCSAFGVEQGYFAKYNLDPKDPQTGKTASTGRRLLAHLAGPVHAGVAGKRGKKLRSIGNEAGGGIAGSLGGAVVGGRLGSLVGGVTGTQLGLNRNQRKGYLKPEAR